MLYTLENDWSIAILPELKIEGVKVNIDEHFHYRGFNKDFGPLNISQVIVFWKEMRNIKGKISCCCYDNYQSTNNCCFLVGSYFLLEYGYEIDRIMNMFNGIRLYYYVDAGLLSSFKFGVSVRDCLVGLKKAICLHLLDVTTFDVNQYLFYECVENGDWNYITPNIIAMANPRNIIMTIEAFKREKITCLIRLNKSYYEASMFQKHGIEHYDLYFPDGTCPSFEIVDKFISILNQVINEKQSKVAIHCMAGLGRTGTLIACWLIKEYNFNAQNAISFIRIMRPGSIVGQQQFFVQNYYQLHIAKDSGVKILGEKQENIHKSKSAFVDE